MFTGAYAIAVAIYPMLLIATLAVGGLGILVNRGGSRRVGAVMIACQLALLALAATEVWPSHRLAGMTILNGLSAIPLLMTPPNPPHRMQRLAAGLFLASALLNATFAMFDQTPSLVALLWFSSAAIDMVMILTLGGFCGGMVGKTLSARFRDHARRSPAPGDRR